MMSIARSTRGARRLVCFLLCAGACASATITKAQVPARLTPVAPPPAYNNDVLAFEAIAGLHATRFGAELASINVTLFSPQHDKAVVDLRSLTLTAQKSATLQGKMPGNATTSTLPSMTVARVRHLWTNRASLAGSTPAGNAPTIKPWARPKGPPQLASVEQLVDNYAVACVTAPAAATVPLADMQAFGTRYARHRRCGLIDEQGNWTTPPDYEYIELIRDEQPSHGYAILMLKNGEPCASNLAPAAVSVCLGKPFRSLFDGGLLAFAADLGNTQFQRGAEIGYLDQEGKWLIAPQFHGADAFRGNIAAVVRGIGPGIIDKQGRWLTPPPPRDPLAAIWLQHGAQEDSLGLIDYQGRLAIPHLFTRIDLNANGSANLCRNDQCILLPLPISAPPTHTAAISKVKESAQRPAASAWTPAAENDVWGYQDAAGRWTIKPRFEAAEPFADGVAAAMIDEKWGIITPDGNWLVKPAFGAIAPFSNGVAVAGTQDTATVLLQVNGDAITVDGRIEGNFDASGIAIIKNDRGQFGYIDRRGKWVVEPRFAAARPFQDGYAIVNGKMPPYWRPDNVGEPAYYVTQLLWLNADIVAVRAQIQAREYFGLMNRNGQWLVPATSK